MNKKKSGILKKLTSVISNYRFLIILILGISSLILGFVGFTKNGISQNLNRTVLDNAYLTLGLLSMNSGAVSGLINWELQLARFFVPALTASTALLALAVLFRRQLNQLKLIFIKDHFIICGLGQKGYKLVHQLWQLGEKLVIIEINESNALLEVYRHMGCIVLTGDATNPEVLLQAGVLRAKHIVSVIGNDGKNAEVAVQAAGLLEGRDNRSITCAIHIDDPQLWHLLREKELNKSNNSGFRLEIFNIFFHGANLLLNYPVDKEIRETGKVPHLLIIGLGRLGQSLLVQAALQWRETQVLKGEKLKISFIDLNAKQKAEKLCLRYPNLEEVCAIQPIQMNVLSPEFQKGDFLFNRSGECEISKVFICLDDDTFALTTALSLNQKTKAEKIPLIVRMAEKSGLARLILEKEKTDFNQYLYVFPLIYKTCMPEIILRGTHEVLARELHGLYLSLQHGEQKPDKRNAPYGDWEGLPESVKQRNRYQADRISIILNKHGFQIAPLTDWVQAEAVFQAEEEYLTVEEMAGEEHEYWCAELASDGWVYGKIKSEKHKTHPALLPWAEIKKMASTGNQDYQKNVQFILNLPLVLSRVGYQIEKRKV